jgi:hypothetical protein
MKESLLLKPALNESKKNKKRKYNVPDKLHLATAANPASRT